MNFKTSQTASKRSSRMNVPHGLKSTSLWPLGRQPKPGSDFSSRTRHSCTRHLTFSLRCYLSNFFLSQFVFLCPGKEYPFSMCKLLEYLVPSYRSTNVRLLSWAQQFSNPLRQAHLCLRVADAKAPHGTAITLSCLAPHVQEFCSANFEVRRARRCDPMSFRVRENLSAP